MFNLLAHFQQMTIFRFCFVMFIACLVELIVASQSNIFTASMKRVNTGLLSLITFEVLLVIVVFISKWRVSERLRWGLFALGLVVYAGTIGIGFL